MITIHSTGERRKVADLVPYVRNSRTHSAEQIAEIRAAIREWGFTNPVVIDEHGGVVAGHGRLIAADAEGMDEVPVTVARGWNEAQRRAYVIADNKLALNAGWDESVLAAELAAIDQMGFDLDLTGFNTDEMLQMLARDIEPAPVKAPTTGATEERELPEPPAVATSRVGDVWLLGRHRVVCGDATVRADWARLQIVGPAGVFTAPGAQRLRSLPSGDAGDWLALMGAWTDLALAHVDVVVCDVQALAQNKRDLLRWAAQYADHVVDVVVWDKGQGTPQRQANILTSVFDWLFILSPQREASRTVPLADFQGKQTNMVRIPKGQRDFADVNVVPTPLALADWVVGSLMPLATTIVDPFAGTGTMLIAAENAGKTACLIEIEPRYVDLIVQRWNAFAGSPARLETTGQPWGVVRAERAVDPLSAGAAEAAA